MSATRRAVIFDLGGVVYESPLAAIAQYERTAGLEAGVINRAVATSRTGGTWGRFERGEIPYEEFRDGFAADCARLGAAVDVDAVMSAMQDVLTERPSMLEAIDELRTEGFSVAALTNNFRPLGSDPLAGRFDVVVESSVEGVRKPEARIYEIVLSRLGVGADEVVFLDDLGINLKPARALGMHTIKVDDPDVALAQMWAALTPAG